MAEPEGESLESWLNKATNPSNRQEDWEYIIGFCDQINKELEGPQISVRLLTHKIQSPQEWEAFQALTVLEACMKNCGRRFHNEVGKFRFLNEMIKLVSPKYLGARVSERVKKKVIEMMFCWSIALPDESKITEAYQMLKTQGLVTGDPEIPADKTLIPSPPDRHSDSILRNQEKSKRLAELLKSKNPEDLQEANRLIKNMVMEDEARFQRESECSSTLEEANNRVKLLNEMLRHFTATRSTHADRELLKDLHDDCEKLRTTMFKMASETQDDDAALGKILQASDELSCVINTYKSVVEGEMVGAETPQATPAQSSDTSSTSALLIDLAGLDLNPSASQHSVLTSRSASSDLYMSSLINPDATPATDQMSMHRPISTQKQSSLSFLNEELLSLGFTESITTATTSQTQQKEVKLQSQSSSPQAHGPLADVLGEPSLLGFPQPVNSSSKSTFQSQSHFISKNFPAATGTAPSVCSGAGGGVSPGLVAASLNDVFVPVPSIKPSKANPITVHNKDGVCVVLNFSATWPASRPDVLVMVLSVLNTAPLPLKHISLHATMPESMALKMQPPSGIELPPYNPLLPPSAIVQVLLLANPHKEKVRMRFRLTYVLGDCSCSETGELDQFPPEDRWRQML